MVGRRRRRIGLAVKGAWNLDRVPLSIRLSHKFWPASMLHQASRLMFFCKEPSRFNCQGKHTLSQPGGSFVFFFLGITFVVSPIIGATLTETGRIKDDLPAAWTMKLDCRLYVIVEKRRGLSPRDRIVHCFGRARFKDASEFTKRIQKIVSTLSGLASGVTQDILQRPQKACVPRLNLKLSLNS